MLKSLASIPLPALTLAPVPRHHVRSLVQWYLSLPSLSCVTCKQVLLQEPFKGFDSRQRGSMSTKAEPETEQVLMTISAGVSSPSAEVCKHRHRATGARSQENNLIIPKKYLGGRILHFPLLCLGFETTQQACPS